MTGNVRRCFDGDAMLGRHGAMAATPLPDLLRADVYLRGERRLRAGNGNSPIDCFGVDLLSHAH